MEPAGETELRSGVPEAAGASARRHLLAETVRQVVDESESAVELAELALRMTSRFPELGSNGWDGAGSLTALLRQLDLGELRISNGGHRSIYDPTRHAEPGTIDLRTARLERLPAVARRICGASQLAPLDAQGWAAFRREIIKEVDANGYHLSKTSKMIRDAMNGKGFRIGRSEVNFVLTGLAVAKYRYDLVPQRSVELNAALLRFVTSIAERSGIELIEEEKGEMEKWLTEPLTAAMRRSSDTKLEHRARLGPAEAP